MMRNLIRISLFSIAIVLGFALPVCAQVSESNAASGVISGRVTTAGGELASTTSVYVSASGAMGPPRSTLVSSDGSFKIEDLEIGVYRVWAGAPGFVLDAPTGAEARGFIHTGESTSIRLKKGGVVTGTVLNSNNAPLVAVPVRAFRIRDEAGKPIETVSSFNERFTDDRGVYRIYGLMPGTYIVAAGGVSRFYGGFGTTGFDQDVPTYAPSSTRDTAMEVMVRSGEEVTADIQYRGEPGHAISGSVSGIPQLASGNYGGANINVIDVKSKIILVSVTASSMNEYAFAAYGLPDGEYELVAQNFSQTRDTRASDAKRVKVQGADVTGVNLVVAPLPAINGRVVLDTTLAPDCVKRRETALQETIIFARRDKQATKSEEGNSNATAQVPMIFAGQIADAVADAKGEFSLRNLHAGTYRLSVSLPSPGWYVKSLTRAVNPRTTDPRVVSDGVTLTNQSVSGLNVTLGEGAATIRGGVVTAEGKPVKDRLLVYLVPVEKDGSSNLLRYFETRSEADGRFELRNLPPGDYLAVTTSSDENRPGFLIRQDSSLRAKVIRDAQKLNQSLTLKPCERVENFELPNQPVIKQ